MSAKPAPTQTRPPKKESLVDLDLNYCVRMRYHLLFKCGQSFFDREVIEELPEHEAYRQPWVEIKDISDLPYKSKLVPVDRPCHSTCPYANDPQPHEW